MKKEKGSFDKFLQQDPPDSQKNQLKLQKKKSLNIESQARTSKKASKRQKRKRQFKINLDNQHHLFEGISLVQYDKFIRTDRSMQIVVTRDILKILLDKCSHLKTFLSDGFKLKRIFYEISHAKKINLNQKMEETLGMLVMISKTIMSEFQNDMADLGIEQDILESKKLKQRSSNESKTGVENAEIFKNLFDKMFKKCVDCYFIMQRQIDWQPLKDKTMRNLLKYLTKCRYQITELFEEFRILGTVTEQKIMWKKQYKASHIQGKNIFKRKRQSKKQRKFISEKELQNERMRKL